MKKTKRIKPQPLQTQEQFEATIAAIVTLEATKRAIEAERDLELQRVNSSFDARIDPVLAQLKGRMALAAAYADEHRKELLTGKTKSALCGLARFGWREGNRKVEQLARVTVENAIAALKALGLGDYVRPKEEIAKDKILADCKDDKTIAVRVVVQKLETWLSVPLANAGLKITQGESFFVEPASDAAETLKPAEAAA